MTSHDAIETCPHGEPVEGCPALFAADAGYPADAAEAEARGLVEIGIFRGAAVYAAPSGGDAPAD
jgi:hypothetical protein